MKKLFFAATLVLAFILLGGCIGSNNAQNNKFEKYGFVLNYPDSADWKDIRDIPFGEVLLQSAMEDSEGGYELVLIKDNSPKSDSPDLSFIALVIADNNSGYTSVNQIKKEELESESGKIGLIQMKNSEIKRIGKLDWIYSDTNKNVARPEMSNVAITFCNKKVAMLMLINGLTQQQQNREYFSQLLETADCIEK